MPGLTDLVMQQSSLASQPDQQPQGGTGQAPTLYDALTRPETMPTFSGMQTANYNAQDETPSALRAVVGRLPWIRHAFDVGDALMTGSSRQRIAANQGTEQDFSRVASADRFRQIQSERSATENLGEGLMDIPATVMEFGIAGRAANALGMVAAPAGASLGARAAAFAGQTAATTALTGSWASRWVRNNESQGRDPLNIRGLPPAFGHEMATVAVLGSMGHFGDTVGANNVGGFIQRGLARAGIGMGEQGALDAVTSAIQNSTQSIFNHDLGLDTGYGLVGELGRAGGHLLRGEYSEAAQEGQSALANATQQAMTFAVFAGMHEAGRTPVMREYSAALRDLHKSGVSRAEAGRQMESVSSLMQGAVERDLSRSEARLLLQSSPAEGAARRYGESLLRTIPEHVDLASGLRPPSQTGSLADLTRPGTSELPADKPAENPVVQTGQLKRDPWASLKGFTRDNLEPLAKIAEKNGVADKIEDLAAQRLTAKQIADKLGIDQDMVNAVRIQRGIPSMSAPGVGVMGGPGKESPEFAQWAASRKPKPAAEAPHPVQVLAERLITSNAELKKVVAELDKLPPLGGKTFERRTEAKKAELRQRNTHLQGEYDRLIAEDKQLRESMRSEQAKNRPAKASEPPKGTPEPPKQPAKPETRPEIPRPRTEPTQMPGFMRPKPETPMPKPKGSWNFTGTRFREAGEGLQFTGRNGQNYQMSEHFIQAGERPSSPNGGVILRVHDESGREVAHVGLFRNKEGHWQGEALHVDKSVRDSKERRTGVAAAMYDYIASQGGHVLPSEGQTPEGKRFWERNRMMKEEKPASLPRPRTEPTQQPGFMRPKPEAKPEPSKAPKPERAKVEDAFKRHFAGDASGTTDLVRMGNLSKEEAKVLFARMTTETQPSLRAIAKEMGVSYETVRQLEVSALGKLDLKRSSTEAQKKMGAANLPEASGVEIGDVSFTKEQMKDPALRAAVRRAKSPLTSSETRAKLIDTITDHMLRGETNAAQETIRQAGELPLTAADHKAISDLARQLEAQAERQGASANPSAKPAEAAKPSATEPAVAASAESRTAVPASATAPAERAMTSIYRKMPDERVRADAQKGVKAAQEELARRQASPEFGKPVTEAERSVLPGGGQPNAGEVPPMPLKTAAIANESIDAWRDKQGMTPILRDARMADPVVWDAAMERLSADPMAGSRLVDDIIAKPRSTTDVENALLVQRTVALRNERDRSAINLVEVIRQKQVERRQKITNPETEARYAELERIDNELADMIDKTDKASRISGSEWGKAGRWRRVLVAEDFTLAGMLRSAEVAAGRPLTETERVEIVDLNQKIAELQKKLDEAEANGKVKPGSGSNEGFAVDQARKTFTRKVAALKETNAPITVKAMRAAGEAVNVPRAIMTSIDFPLLRQGQLVMASHPSIAMKAIPEMLKSYQSDKVADRALYDIQHRPNAAFGDRVGLEITDRNAPITGREEGFLSRFMGAENIAALKKSNPQLGTVAQVLTSVPRASERSYQTVMNRLRSEMFDMMIDKLARNGKVTDAEGRVIANYVNVMTGRGPLGAKGEKAAQLLSQVFFAPRWTMSRFQYVLGQPLLSNFGESAPRARKMIAMEYARTLSGIGVALAAAAAAGLAVVTDPRSSAFGQVQTGNTFLDFTGGLRRPTTLLSQLWSGSRVDSYGVPMPIRGDVPHGQPNASDQIWRYVRSSFAPAPGAAVDLVSGTDLGGRPVSVAGEAGNMVSPLFIRDVVGAMKDLDVPQGTTASLLALMGMSMQTRDAQPRPTTPVTPLARRESILRGQIQSLENMMRGNRLSGGQMIRGTPPNAETRARIQRQIDLLVRQLP